MLLLLGQLKSLFNEEFLGHTRGWVTVYSAVKVASLWGLAQRYFVATVDATFISKYELDVTEVGTEVDLVLSFVAVVATEAWTVFV